MHNVTLFLLLLRCNSVFCVLNSRTASSLTFITNSEAIIFILVILLMTAGLDGAWRLQSGLCMQMAPDTFKYVIISRYDRISRHDFCSCLMSLYTSIDLRNYI